jgi:hypothetical protein
MTIDVDIAGRSRFVETLRAFQPAIVAGTSLSVQINDVIELFRLAKGWCPEAINVLGGTHATAAGQYLYPFHKDWLDAVIVGEGLTSILNIAEIIEHNRWTARKGDVPGLLCCEGHSLVWGKPAVAETPDAYDPDLSYHHESYDFEIFKCDDGTQPRTFQMMTAFGCLNACFFCFASTNKRGESSRVERRMTLSAVERILSRARSLGYEAVYFDDDTFTRDRSHALAVAKMCKTFGLVFGCHTRPDCEDDELIAELARAGCRYMFSGLETVVPEILVGANKTRDPIAYRESYRRSYHSKKASCLPASTFLIHGMPRRTICAQEPGDKPSGLSWCPDTLEDSMSSIDFAVRELDPCYLSMNVLRFIPGVPFSDNPRFAFLRPVSGPLHGGYFDRIWLVSNGVSDPRCFHPVLRAFEGAGSPIPPHMTPYRCYQILRHAVDAVNAKNLERGRNQTSIVVDRWFKKRFLKKQYCGRTLTYELAPFALIDAEANSLERTSYNQAKPVLAELTA